MKVIKQTALLLIVFMAVALSGCGDSTPAAQVAKIIDEAAAQIDKTESAEDAVAEIRRQQSEVLPQINEIIEQNADEELSDSDKSRLRDAMKRFVEVNIKKSASLSQEKPESLDATANMLLEQTVYPVIDRATRLGDLNQAFEM